MDKFAKKNYMTRSELIRFAVIKEIKGDKQSLVTNTEMLILEKNKKDKSLDKILGDITPKNVHKETDWGEPVGNEIW